MGCSACVTCHQRKVKCDAQIRGFPCSNCISSRKSGCRLHQKRRHALARSVDNPVRIQSRPSIGGPFNRGSNLSEPLQDDAIESYSQSKDIHAEQQGEVDQSTGYLANPSGIEGRAIHKGVRITYVGKDVSNISFLVRQRLAGQNEKVYHFPSTEIARKYMSHESDRVPKEAFMLPDKAVADELIHAYFTHVNPGCPIIDEAIFMAQYWGQDAADPPSLLVLQAVLLVGAHVSRERPERDALKSTFFRRAKLLFDARVEWNRDYMVQAALLLVWHSEGVEDVAANAWYWVGLAERIAIGLGMHRDTTCSSLFRSDKRRWRRIWWILFQHDVTVSVFYGRPQAINLDECDVAPLDALDLEGCGSEDQIEYVLKYTELCILISRFLRERFAVRTTLERRKTTLVSADEALANWCLLLPPSLHLRSSGTSLLTSKLHLAYSNFLILLHRPNPRASHRVNASGRNDADICIAAANAITSIFEDMGKEGQIQYVGLAEVNALFTGMIQVSVELRFSNPVLAIHARRRFDSTLLSLQVLAEYWTVGESILQLFEVNVAFRGGEASGGDLIRDGGSSSASCNQRSQDGTTLSRRNFQSQDAKGTLRPGPPSDLDVLAAAANAAVQSIHAGLIEQEQEEVRDWRQLFPFTTPNQEAFMLPEDVSLLEDEWREIYWQEPNMFETLGDAYGGGGGGGWP